MAKVTPYVQDKLASSLGYVPAFDKSAGAVAGAVAEAGKKGMDWSLKRLEAIQKQNSDIEQKIKNIHSTMEAYEKSTEAETKLMAMIDEVKQANVMEPHKAIEEIQDRGQMIVQETMASAYDNPGVQEKMAGILINSLRGKINETHSWVLAQNTANAKGRIQNIFGGYCTQAAGSSDISRTLGILSKLDNPAAEDMELIESVKWAYGAENTKELDKAKKNIASSYILGLLDREETNQVIAALDSGLLDSYLAPDDKHKYHNMANTMIKAQERQERMDNLFQIYDIKTNAILQAQKGEYTVSQANADNERIVALGGKPTTSLVNQSIQSEKIRAKEDYTKNRTSAIKDITEELGKISKKGKIDSEAQLKDIIEFQNLVESKKQFLTATEYKNYMTKVNEPKIKKIRNMGKNIIGLPHGEIAKKDAWGKSYLAIYNFAEKAYAGKENQHNAINSMITDFVRYADQYEAKTGKPLTDNEAQNLCNKVIFDQRRKTNPALNNIPENGRIMKDKNGRTIKMYPNGKYEVMK